jgi:threonylcarbamoyladenosine tRNA methylthiotransferase MtaB
MVRRLLAAVPELKRLRLSSLDPAAIDEDVWRLLADEPRLMPHLHLSVQAGSDMVLKRMKRRHSRAQALEVVARAREARPGIALGADLIAGFPTESDEMFADTLDFVRSAGLPYLHVFPYSERPDTPAARMPPVPVAERRARAGRLRDAGVANAARFHAGLVGSETYVLSETPEAGHTEHFAPVRMRGEPGRVMRARIVGADARGVLAEGAYANR